MTRHPDSQRRSLSWISKYLLFDGWFWGAVLGTSMILLNWTSACSEEPYPQGSHGEHALKRYEFLQIRMGIPINITLYAPSELIANQASQAAYRRFREIDRIMSDYDPDSELMQLCSSAKPGTSYPVSPDLFEVIQAAQTLSVKTDGAFDVTVGPVVKLWRIARRRKQLPDPERLKKALESVGYQNIQLDASSRSLSFNREQMRIDLGAIAKGFAADEAINVLKKHGINSALVDAGGDLVASAPPPGKEHWSIEMEQLQPINKVEGPVPVVKLANNAVATSGDLYQYIEVEGKRYSHIVDPRTGLGLTRSSSVTVIAPTGMQADSLASAISVMGPKRGLKFVEEMKGVEFRMATIDGKQKKSVAESKGFSKHLVTVPRILDK